MQCREVCVCPSTGSVDDTNYNAMAKASFASLECEVLDWQRFRSPAEARMAMFQFIEGFYNPISRQSPLGYLSPIKYEVRERLTKG